MPKAGSTFTRKETFWWSKRTPIEWCHEWQKRGHKTTAKVEQDEPCALRPCHLGRKIKPGQEYWQAGSLKFIAHVDCVDAYLRRSKQDEADKRWREQEKTRVIPPENANVIQLPDAALASLLRETELPVSESSELAQLRIENLELKTKIARLEGFKDAVELFLSHKKVADNLHLG